jgi:hypothetical protein
MLPLNFSVGEPFGPRHAFQLQARGRSCDVDLVYVDVVTNDTGLDWIGLILGILTPWNADCEPTALVVVLQDQWQIGAQARLYIYDELIEATVEWFFVTGFVRGPYCKAVHTIL